jgi:YVTN family beta-propeller protein
MNQNSSTGRRLSPLASLVFAAVGLALVLGGCELSSNLDDELEPGEIVDIVYSEHIQPVFDQKCVSCHAGSSAASGLDLSDWPAVFAGSDFGEAIIPFDPSHSLAVELATRLAGGAHPAEFDADTLSAGEIELLSRWIEEGAADDQGNVPFEDATQLLYVCNQDEASVSVIDTETNVVIRRIDLIELGFSALAKPHHAAVAPDGSHWYVSLIGEDAVLKFTRSNELVGQAEFETPGMLLSSPDGSSVFVGRSLSAPSPPASVGTIDVETMEVEEIAVLFPRPHALAVDATGTVLYTASLGQNVIMVVDPQTTDVQFTAVAGPLNAFVQHVLTPDGGLLFSSGQLTNRILAFDTSDLSALQLVKEIEVGAAPWHPALSRDGDALFVGNKDDNTVSVISVPALEVIDSVTGPGLAEPHGSAVSADDRWVYISSRNTREEYTPRYDLGDNRRVGTVAVIDRATNEIVKVIEVGMTATGLGIRP